MQKCISPDEIISNWVLGLYVFACACLLAHGETGASCYGGRLLQCHFMQNYHIDGEIAEQQLYPDPSKKLLAKQNDRGTRIIGAMDNNHFYTPETFLSIFTIFLQVPSIAKNFL